MCFDNFFQDNEFAESFGRSSDLRGGNNASNNGFVTLRVPVTIQLRAVSGGFGSGGSGGCGCNSGGFFNNGGCGCCRRRCGW
ncbi:MAG: hypothetical protein ACOX6U_05580 [Oscillospiraceae bacterium]|jgi:hypothetical protein